MPIIIGQPDTIDIGTFCGTFIGYVLILLLVYGTIRWVRKRHGEKPIVDFCTSRARTIPIAGLVITAATFVFIDQLRGADARTQERRALIARYRGQPYEPVQEIGRVPLLGPICLDMIVLPFWFGVAVVLGVRTRSIRVLVFRSFGGPADTKLRSILQQAGKYFGRVDTMINPNETYHHGSSEDRSWGVIGSASWQVGVQTLLKKARLAILDVSTLTPGLRFEMEQLQGSRRVRTLFLAAAGSVTSSATEHWSTSSNRPVPRIVWYDSVPTREFVSDLIGALESTMSATGFRWKVHKATVLSWFDRDWWFILRRTVTLVVLVGLIAWLCASISRELWRVRWGS